MTERYTNGRSAAEIREHAREFSPDLLPDSPALPPGDGVSWLYAPGEFELAKLERLVREGFAANRFVHYAANYGSVQGRTTLRRRLTGRPGQVLLTGDGSIAAAFDDADPAPLPPSHDGARRLDVPDGARMLVLGIRAPEGEPAAVAVADDGALLPGAPWEALDVSGVWRPALERIGAAGRAPHQDREPTVVLPVPRDADGIFSLEAPVLGRPVISCAGSPRISTGESRDEALAASPDAESRHELRRLPDGRWTSVHRLAFRHLVVLDAEVADVTVEASVRPAPRRGAFVCSDDLLNRIWGTSAYTLRLCLQELVLDGIKRDRMPWAGDQALNTLANAYALGDGAIVRDGLTALGRPRHGYVNGISDYSLWWVVNSASYRRCFGDRDHLVREAGVLAGFLRHLAGYADERGLFRPREEPDGFGDASAGSVFLDWGVTIDPSRTSTALQVLWHWALRSAAELLAETGSADAARWAALADRVRQTLLEEAWDPAAGAWREYLEGGGTASPHANMLAVLSGLTPPDAPGVRRSLLAAERAGTPFMTSFTLRALAQTGEHGTALDRIRDLWGAMLDAGATTFWEEFDEPGDGRYAMYGRPYGKSLCHAWSSGPAALLPELVLGIRPLADGWAEFEVRPHLGALAWADAIVPAPAGDIVVTADASGTTVEIPAGTTLVDGERRHAGPARVTLAPA
ncbi:hypothetical protein [Naasia sp. SYSU D00057]|uniref:alpha-L-rhamnosidase-related protein n=1 Tax=Naasia sp. SYSU D00057 TaxID=2817380 RepID=UPI001B305BDC|nr:hypothetical protein [Naasia sp. SYSU D00057]